jgi:hypothetical protein
VSLGSRLEGKMRRRMRIRKRFIRSRRRFSSLILKGLIRFSELVQGKVTKDSFTRLILLRSSLFSDTNKNISIIYFSYFWIDFLKFKLIKSLGNNDCSPSLVTHFVKLLKLFYVFH